MLVARDPDERAWRALRLGVVEATFDPLPVDAAVARECARLSAAVSSRGAPAPPCDDLRSRPPATSIGDRDHADHATDRIADRVDAAA